MSPEDIDPLIRGKAICKLLGGISTRTLYDHWKSGKFPPPDVPALARGEPNLWRMSTVQRGIDELNAKRKSRTARAISSAAAA